MDVLNFISWLKAGKYTTTAPIDAVTVIGVPNTTRGDAYLPATVPISALQTNIGKLMGGGIVVSEWVENGVHKALVASLTTLSTSTSWTTTSYDITAIGSTAESYSNGSTNTNAIIAQTGVPADITYAAGIARLYLGGGYNDWYLPAVWELTMCYNASAVVNRILGANGFALDYYWSSTEVSATEAWAIYFSDGAFSLLPKNTGSYVRAVRIHTL